MQIVLGIIFHFIGGFSSGSFYMPYKKVRGWGWESYWIVGGLFSWLIVPPLAAALTVPGFAQLISQTPASTLFYTYLFGLLWGIGGLTYGLGVRHLGVSLGSSVILGLCMVFGALIPSVYYQWAPQAGKDAIGDIAGSGWGLTVLVGLGVCLVGIAVCGKAGIRKEKELKAKADRLGFAEGQGQNGNGGGLRYRKPVLQAAGRAQAEATRSDDSLLASEAAPARATPAAQTEYRFGLGLALAVVSGVLSACFNFGIEAGKPMAQAAAAQGVNTLFVNNVIFVVILWGGLTTNLVWCVGLNARNRSFGDYGNANVPLLKNYGLCALAGTAWFLQFFFYGMGESKMGNGASSWILHMSFIILVANGWGLFSGEWKDVSPKTRRTLLAGVAVIILAVLIVGKGNSAKP